MLFDTPTVVLMQVVLERRPKPQPKPAKQSVPQKPGKPPKASEYNSRARPPYVMLPAWLAYLSGPAPAALEQPAAFEQQPSKQAV